MTIVARDANGVEHQFPDGTSPDVIDNVMRQNAQTTAGPEREVSTSTGGKIKDLAEALYLGAKQPYDIAAARLASAFPSLSNLGTQFGLPATQEVTQSAGKLRAENPYKLAQTVGNVAGVTPMLAAGGLSVAPETYGGAVLSGGATGALLSEANNPYQFAGDVGLSALLGIPGKFAGDVVSGTIAPAARAGIQKLSDMGVTLSPGQLMAATKSGLGEFMGKTESALTSVPGFGDVIAFTRNLPKTQFGNAVISKFADMANTAIPKTGTGEEAVSSIMKNVSHQYEQLVPSLSFVRPRNWRAEAQRIYDSLNIPSSMTDLRDQFWSVVEKNIDKAADTTANPFGVISGRNLQNALSDLGDSARTYMKSSEGWQRRLATGLSDIRSWMSNELANQNQSAASELTRLNSAWNAGATLQKAASYAGDAISPTTLERAVKSMNKGMTRGVFQDMVRAGREVPRELASSGTAERIARGAAATSLIGGGAYAADKYDMTPSVPTGVAGLAALAALYSPQGRALLQKNLSRNAGPVMQAIAEGMRTAISPTTLAAAIAEPAVKPAGVISSADLVLPDGRSVTLQVPANADDAQIRKIGEAWLRKNEPSLLKRGLEVNYNVNK